MKNEENSTSTVSLLSLISDMKVHLKFNLNSMFFKKYKKNVLDHIVQTLCNEERFYKCAMLCLLSKSYILTNEFT